MVISVEKNIGSRNVFYSEKINKYICDKRYCVNVYNSVTSTNDIVKEAANQNVSEGLVVIAEEQTKGKGRLGRKFFSPSVSGIYMSILLRPNEKLKNHLLITTGAAVAVCRAIEIVASKKTYIKWVNDIYYKDKKICGILTEASFNVSEGKLLYAVLGIGINVSLPENGFPDDISNVAGALCDDNSIDKAHLTAEIINQFDLIYKDLDNKRFLDEYISRNFIIGKDINILRNNVSIKAKAVGIDSDCNLIVEYGDKITEHLSSGEVSVRLC